jgi:hypothetical protein
MAMSSFITWRHITPLPNDFDALTLTRYEDNGALFLLLSEVRYGSAMRLFIISMRHTDLRADGFANVVFDGL